MYIIDRIKGRKNVIYQENEGTSLVAHLINEFQDRKFTFRGTKRKYSGIDREDLLKAIQSEMDSALVLYRYITRVKRYTDRKGISHAEIKIVGKASAVNRYNPLDIEMEIKTEMPIK
jgi:hypothetical protein